MIEADAGRHRQAVERRWCAVTQPLMYLPSVFAVEGALRLRNHRRVAGPHREDLVAGDLGNRLHRGLPPGEPELHFVLAGKVARVAAQYCCGRLVLMKQHELCQMPPSSL